MTTTTTTSAGSGGLTGEQAANNITGDIKGVKAAIERGDWLDAGLSITNVAMDVIGIAGDPLGAAGSAGFGWIIQHISFLREPFEALLGKADSITGSASGWARAGQELTNTAEKYRQAATKETNSWQGTAGDSYRRASATQAQGLDALAEVSKGVGEAITGAGQLLAEVRKTVLDFINKCVQKVIQIIIEALSKSWLTFGASIAEGIVRSVAEAVQTAQKIVSKIQKFVSSLQKIISTVQKIVQLAKTVKQLLETIGGKANTTPGATTTQAPQVNTSGIDTAANRQYTNPNSGVTGPAYGPTQTSGYGGYQQLSGNQAPQPSYGQTQTSGYGGYRPPSGNPTTLPAYGPTQTSGYGGYQQPGGGGGGYTPGGYTGTGMPGQVSQVQVPGGGGAAPGIPGQNVPGYGPSGPPPGNTGPAPLVDRAKWIGSAVEILINHGVDPSRINAEQIAQIVDRTSGGNPNAIDMRDPNAANGFPPKGMMQITDPVFQQHQVPGHDNIWAPVDNMLAGVMHLLQTWGSLMAAMSSLDAGSGGATTTIGQ